MEGKLTKGELCMGSILTMFIEHASKDGDKDHLSKSEVKQLLEQEFPNFVTGGSGKEMADGIMASLDFNKDQKLDFQEFITLIGSFSIICKGLIDECKMSPK